MVLEIHFNQECQHSNTSTHETPIKLFSNTFLPHVLEAHNPTPRPQSWSATFIKQQRKKGKKILKYEPPLFYEDDILYTNFTHHHALIILQNTLRKRWLLTQSTHLPDVHIIHFSYALFDTIINIEYDPTSVYSQPFCLQPIIQGSRLYYHVQTASLWKSYNTEVYNPSLVYTLQQLTFPPEVLFIELFWNTGEFYIYDLLFESAQTQYNFKKQWNYLKSHLHSVNGQHMLLAPTYFRDSNEKHERRESHEYSSISNAYDTFSNNSMYQGLRIKNANTNNKNYTLIF